MTGSLALILAALVLMLIGFLFLLHKLVGWLTKMFRA